MNRHKMKFYEYNDNNITYCIIAMASMDPSSPLIKSVEDMLPDLNYPASQMPQHASACLYSSCSTNRVDGE